MNGLEQKMNALQIANEVRRSNAKLKRDITSAGYVNGMEAAADLVEGFAAIPGAGRLRVVQVLEAIHQAGDARVSRWLNRAGITPTRRLEALTDRQVRALALELRASAKKVRKGR